MADEERLSDKWLRYLAERWPTEMRRADRELLAARAQHDADERTIADLRAEVERWRTAAGTYERAAEGNGRDALERGAEIARLRARHEALRGVVEALEHMRCAVIATGKHLPPTTRRTLDDVAVQVARVRDMLHAALDATTDAEIAAAHEPCGPSDAERAADTGAERARCASCPHPHHRGLCTHYSGGTAHACGCSCQTARRETVLRPAAKRDGDSDRTEATQYAAEPACDQARFDLGAHLTRQREWSARTFGPGPRAAGVVDHIRKELREIEADPDDLEEWIDVVILAFDGAWRSGATPDEIIAKLDAKQTKNERREWPDWRTASPDRAIEHVRTETRGEEPPR